MNLWAAPKWQEDDTKCPQSKDESLDMLPTPPSTPPARMYLCEMRSLLLPDTSPDSICDPIATPQPDELKTPTASTSIITDLVTPVAEESSRECVSPEGSLSRTTLSLSPELLDGVFSQETQQRHSMALQLWEQFSHALGSRVLSSSPWVSIHEPHINIPTSPSAASTPVSSPTTLSPSKRRSTTLAPGQPNNTYPNVGYWSRALSSLDLHGNSNRQRDSAKGPLADVVADASLEAGFVMSCGCIGTHSLNSSAQSTSSSFDLYRRRHSVSGPSSAMRESIPYYLQPMGGKKKELAGTSSDSALMELPPDSQNSVFCHPLSTTLLIQPSPCRNMKAMMAHFRAFGALGGRRGRPCMGRPPAAGISPPQSEQQSALDQPSTQASSASGKDGASTPSQQVEAFSSEKKVQPLFQLFDWPLFVGHCSDMIECDQFGVSSLFCTSAIACYFPVAP